MKMSKLLALALVLLISVGTLAGSTIAWFTDQVTIERNTITAGNLDMKVFYKPFGASNTKWTEVTSTTKLFKEGALYEPGYTEAFWLKIENVGNLAFKATIAPRILSETSGVNQAGERFELSDYLVMKYNGMQFNLDNLEIFEATYPTRDSLDNFNLTEKKLNEADLSLWKDSAFLPTAEMNTRYCLVVLQMPTTVGNEANHNGNAPQIELGMDILATQLAYESDSFGSDYDKNATYPDVSIPGLPKADLVKDESPLTVDLYDLTNGITPLNKQQPLDVSYTFTAQETAEEAALNDYANWHADFVVRIDSDVAANTIGLGGEYGGLSVGFKIPVDAKAGDELRLLETAGIKYNYVEICEQVKVFRCGAFNLDAENEGTKLTVELRLYEPVEEDIPLLNTNNERETGTYKIVATQEYTFKAPATNP